MFANPSPPVGSRMGNEKSFNPIRTLRWWLSTAQLRKCWMSNVCCISHRSLWKIPRFRFVFRHLISNLTLTCLMSISSNIAGLAPVGRVPSGNSLTLRVSLIQNLCLWRPHAILNNLLPILHWRSLKLGILRRSRFMECSFILLKSGFCYLPPVHLLSRLTMVSPSSRAFGSTAETMS